ncbi:MAG: hypothetical protein ACPGPF_08530, partial [Pontibacterium sp.]
GLGVLAMETTLTENKMLRNVEGVIFGGETPVTGYEIHAGVSEGAALQHPLFTLNVDGQLKSEGVRDPSDQIFGTYLHGVFDQPDLLADWLDWAGLGVQKTFDYPAFREAQINRLADEVEAVMPVNKLLALLALPALLKPRELSEPVSQVSAS